MKKTNVSLKAIFKYISTVITWSIFVILFCCAAFLVYYFISLQLYGTKGDKYKPNFSIYTIVSPSMTPKIKVYDVIVNFKVDSPTDIKVGDIITFKSTSAFTYDMTITHRVVDIQVVNGEYQFITKGDNNAVADSAPALYSNVIGKAQFKVPQLGRLQVFISSKLGWLFAVVLPALIIIIKDILKLIRINNIKGNAIKASKTRIATIENESNKKPIEIGPNISIVEDENSKKEEVKETKTVKKTASKTTKKTNATSNKPKTSTTRKKTTNTKKEE